MPHYTPKVHYNNNVQQITIPNKNVQSYFMRNETSYFVKEEEKIQDPNEIVTLIITCTDILMSYNDTIKILTYDKQQYSGFNMETYFQENVPLNTYTLEVIEDKDFFEKMFCFGNFSSVNFSCLDEALNYLQIKLICFFNIGWRGSHLNLVFQDLFTRTEIIGLIDMFIKYMNVKGIMITPFSLAIGFGCNTSTASVFRKENGFISVGFIDDFCFLYANKITKTEIHNVFYSHDSVDFVEEFARQSVGIGNKTYYCHFCEYRTNVVDEITEHIKLEHSNELSEDYEDVINNFYTESKEDFKISEIEPERNYLAILNFIGGEKEKKVCLNKIFLGFDEDDELCSKIIVEGDKVFFDKTILGALKGMQAFLSVDCSKEMWMSDKEWLAAGLRILKEKLLFYI